MPQGTHRRSGSLLALTMLLGCSSRSQPSGFDNAANGPLQGGSGSSAAASGNGSLGTSGSSAPVSNGALGSVSMMAVEAGTSPDGAIGDPKCPNGPPTTISGVVYDPALQDPLYNVSVYVPVSAQLPPLPKGASCGACNSLIAPFLAAAVTDAAGHFSIQNAPSGTNIPLVVQTGKWRKEYTLPSVTACTDNPQPDKTLRLPKNAINGDGDLPDIAISTGNADSLECLLLRIGVDASEWMGGAGTAGHIHIFRGNGANTMMAGPQSFMSLWDQTAHLMQYDVTLLSCEGGETANVTVASQQALLDYANAGGRVFASHFHYNWFNQGPWAALSLATWYTGSNPLDPADKNHISFPTDVYTTLLNGMPFPEGVALQAWLGNVGALTGGKLPVYYARHNSDVLPQAGPPAPVSQPWIVIDKSVTVAVPNGIPAANAAQYFSVDLPIAATQKCGRVVYSDLHVSGGAATVEPMYSYFSTDYPGLPLNSGNGVVPSGCATHELTPQEKALEFMIFDLSSCLIPVGQVAMPPRQPK